MSGPQWKLEKDKKTVTVGFPTTPPVKLTIGTAEVESMLKNLGDYRGSMEPEIDEHYALGKACNAIPDPRWATEPDAMMGNTLLHIRDPRYGWLHYMLPREKAKKLAHYIIAQSEQSVSDAPSEDELN